MNEEQAGNQPIKMNKGALRVYDVIVPEESGSGKTYWKTIGVCFKRETAEGMTMRLFMYPGLNFVIREKSSSVAKAEDRKAPDDIAV